MLLAAFSPVVVDLLSHLAAEPWAVYPVAFWLLFAREYGRAAPGAPRPRTAWILLAAGLVLELLMLRAGWPRMARPGLVAAAFGVTCLVGHPAPLRASLLLWCIPVPYFVLAIGHPTTLRVLGAPAAALVSALGLDVALETQRGNEVFARFAESSLALGPPDAGLALAAVLAGFGWAAALVREASVAAAARQALVAGVVAIPVQVAVLAVGLGLGAAVAPERGRLVLDATVPVATLVGLAFVWRAGRAEREPAGA